MMDTLEKPQIATDETNDLTPESIAHVYRHSDVVRLKAGLVPSIVAACGFIKISKSTPASPDSLKCLNCLDFLNSDPLKDGLG